jgi:predicted Zn-dependent protease
MKRLAQTCRISLVLLVWLVPLCAHGVTSEQIKQLTAQIQRAPTNAELYVRRGELHRQLGNAKAALEDFDTAQKLAPERLEIDVYRARLHLDANVPELAQLVLDRYLKLRPHHTEAVLLRAQVNEKLGAHTLAIQDYTIVLSRLAQPKPELFVARAQLQIEAHQLEAALTGLDDGIAKLGALVTLQSFAVEIEVKRKRWDAALARLDTIAAQSPRQEHWLVQRAEILLQAGRYDEAQQSLTTALQLIAALPDHLRRAPAITALEAKARALLHTKKSGNNSAPGTS